MITTCIKWLPDREGISAADEAALELALRHGEATGTAVSAITVGGAGADRAMADAVAAGAASGVAIHTDGTLSSWETATALAPHLASATTVWCGDHSADRGSGSVPAFLAALLGVQQALGAVSVDLAERPADPSMGITVSRRLDGGRRELLAITGPAVISVEGAAARLRRASLRARLATRADQIVHVSGPRSAHLEPPLVPYRPRARQVPAPPGDTALARLGALLHGTMPPRRGELVELEPAAAAARILHTLTGWGYLADAVAGSVDGDGS